MLLYTSYISVAVTLVYTVNFKDLNSPFPLLRFRSALHCGYSGITVIKIAASNGNIECFREYFAVGYRAPNPSFFLKVLARVRTKNKPS
jgi:hypothetical protein